jgi:hypothetical protein
LIKKSIDRAFQLLKLSIVLLSLLVSARGLRPSR